MLSARAFVFDSYIVDTSRSMIVFKYRVEFAFGISKSFTDRLYLPNVEPEMWKKVPKEVLEPTLQALLIMLGINYWCVFPTRNIRINGFLLSKEQAHFWDTLYLNGLAEFFYDMQMDFHGLIAFPYDESFVAPSATRFPRQSRSLLLHGAGKDSVLSAELLKAAGAPFDFFAFAPTPAHERIATLVGANMVIAKRHSDPWISRLRNWFGISSSYPSVSTFSFVATLIAELCGYDSIIFSNERSADFGNLTYRGLPVNHQWCKSSAAEALVNKYITDFITPDITTRSLLREFSELEIVRRVVGYPQYLHSITSCNAYFWLPRAMQRVSRSPYWCKKCPKCVFIFACYAAYLPKIEVIDIFGADLFADQRLLPLFRRILGVEGFKPLDCVGEPEEMILAMHLALRRGEYEGEPAAKIFKEYFPLDYDFKQLERKVFAEGQEDLI